MTQWSEHQDGSVKDSTPSSLSVVNNGPRAINKYTESPVPTRKEFLVQQHELQKIPRQLQESPVIPDPNELSMIPDSNGLYTLV